ncbi:putative Derlin-3 [Hibiscus syriacus]|uniref:Derlin-3 n=1 Tax=Hibiscus syriacus TaxID=106335 RepID=A0A6A3C449_HIBSY|nr:putative Derlin-3 [Hibiscus syriacus]
MPICSFDHRIIGSETPQATKPAGSGVYPTTTPCFCKLKLKNFPSQTALLPLSNSSGDSTPESSTSAAGFHLDGLTLRRLSGKPVTLRIEVYTGRMGHTCGVSSGKLVGRVQITIDLAVSQTRPSVFQNGWMKLGNEPGKPTAKLYLTVKGEPDPRFVFQFGGEPECSPVVFQIQGNIRQPVFSCKFSADRSRSRFLPPDFSNKNRGWMRTFSGEKERQGRERKGWMIMIHDLSGSPVAAASMITPFVPSPGTDRHGERGPIDGLGYKFELVTENGPNNGISIAEATMSVKKGGQFCIDKRVSSDSFALSLRSPVKGFVMGATVEGEGKISKPVVQVGMQHVTCMADAALFIALSAAIDLSMDACQLFSSKLRKELCHDHDNNSFSLNPI